jgi:hypothetical protein
MDAHTMWQDFQERTFPRLVGNIQGTIGREVPVEVDWESLGDEPGLDESLEYDLNMLVRGLDGVDRFSPWVDERWKTDPSRICEGIERVRIRRVRRPEDCRLVVEGGTLHVDFRWEGTGRFSPREVEALLLNREGEQVSRWVEEPGIPLPARLDEVPRNRLPALLRAFEMAMGRPLPMRLDWPDLDAASDAPSRLVYLLGELASALRELTKVDPGIVPLREDERDRLRRRAEERKQIVLDSVRNLHVRGGRLDRDPVCRVSEGTLELFVFQDEGDEPKGHLFEFRRFPGCRARQMKEHIESLLDLEIGPLLRQMRDEELPKAQTHLNEHLHEVIGKCSHLGLRDQHGLRKLLNSRPVALEVDWESFTAPERVEDQAAALEKLECGPFFYNREHGELFHVLFHALDEAFQRSPTFPARFLGRVRAIRYEQVSDPSDKELVTDEATLILRQCLYQAGGEISDPTDLAMRLLGAVEAIPGETVEAQIRALEELLPGDVAVSVHPSLVKRGPGAEAHLVERVLAPLQGAFRILLDRPGHAKSLRSLLRELWILHAASLKDQGFSVQESALFIRCRPEDGPSAFPAGEELVRALDQALALHVRSEIAEISREQPPFWDRILRERFGQEVPVEVDWASFLTHPEEGGYRLYPLYVAEEGVLRLIYALNRWMDEDETFRAKARDTIRGLRITSAPDVGSRALSLEDGVLVSRCYPDMSLKGYLTMDELQMRLLDLLEQERPSEEGDY